MGVGEVIQNEQVQPVAGEMKGGSRVTGTQGPGSMTSLVRLLHRGETVTGTEVVYGRERGKIYHRFSSLPALQGPDSTFQLAKPRHQLP